MKLGIDLGGTKIEIIAPGYQGVELLRRRVPTPQGDYAATLHAIEKSMGSDSFDFMISAIYSKSMGSDSFDFMISAIYSIDLFDFIE